MKILIPLAAILGIALTAVPVLYFYSPQYELSALRAEISVLREQNADLQSSQISDALVIVVAGMLALTALLLTAFFLMLCLLANVRPADFFLPSAANQKRITGPAAEHSIITKTTSGNRNPAEIYPVGERYTMEWGAL
jgi:hypothetical protein